MATRARRGRPGVGLVVLNMGRKLTAHPRVHKRIELTGRLLEDHAVTVERVPAHGESPLEHVMSLVLLGDLVSIYLAVLAGVDPSRMEAIERLKRDLG